MCDDIERKSPTCPTCQVNTNFKTYLSATLKTRIFKEKGNVKKNLSHDISIIHQHYSEYSIVYWEYNNSALAQKKFEFEYILYIILPKKKLNINKFYRLLHILLQKGRHNRHIDKIIIWNHSWYCLIVFIPFPIYEGRR